MKRYKESDEHEMLSRTGDILYTQSGWGKPVCQFLVDIPFGFGKVGRRCRSRIPSPIGKGGWEELGRSSKRKLGERSARKSEEKHDGERKGY